VPLSIDDRQIFSNLQRRSWLNLKAWLRRVHRRENVYVPALETWPDAKDADPDAMVRAMFRTVIEMRDVPWGMVLKVLAVQFRILAAHDSRWTVDQYAGYVAKVKQWRLRSGGVVQWDGFG